MARADLADHAPVHDIRRNDMRLPRRRRRLVTVVVVVIGVNVLVVIVYDQIINFICIDLRVATPILFRRIETARCASVIAAIVGRDRTLGLSAWSTRARRPGMRWSFGVSARARNPPALVHGASTDSRS